MSNFPNNFDDDTTLPPVNDNITEVGDAAINALRDFAFAVEQNIGLGAAGTTGSIASRLGVSIALDGSIKTSAIASMGLVTLPITQDQIADFAQIPEFKLKLDHKTQDLFNYIRDLSGDVNTAIGWINTTGIKLEPHLFGAIYRHTLDQIDVNADPNKFLLNKFRLLRDNDNSFELVNDINNEFLAHQWADGSLFGTIGNVITNDGSAYPSNYAHTASGVFLNTSRFATIPQTAQDLQLFADFIDNSSIFLLGTRIQNLYSNGISKESRSSSLALDGYGSPLIPNTLAIAFLKNVGTNSGPFDDIDAGDDIIELKPSSADTANNSFDEKFALVKIGDIIRINYGSVEVAFVIKEKKYIQNLGVKKFIIRIAGKNLQYNPNAIARIDRPLFNINKYGVLAIAASNSQSSSIQSSLIVGSARGAQALGLGFNPDQFDSTHYLLYLALYPTGYPQDGYLILPPIDVTGNQGTTPGLYTLHSVVESTNNAFRKAGFNYRFIAFEYKGEFGISLADSYNNAGFSILNAVVAGDGSYNAVATTVAFPNNVVSVFSNTTFTASDPLGFGISGANIASPPYQTSYASAEAAINPTKLFLPLKRNNYYVNGIEREKMTLDIEQLLDGYGDGYWNGIVTAKTIIPGPTPTGRVQTTYRIPLDLSASQLKIGKTLVVQSLDGYGSFPNDFGRFIIQDLTFDCVPSAFTDITVYDAVHGTAISPTTTLAIGSKVAIYFNSDSVSFNKESATDFTSVSPFKRHFEVYIDEQGATFTHERGRINCGTVSPLIVNGNVPLVNYSELIKMDLIKISPKLRGYQFGSVNKITLNINHLNNTTGIFDGYLSYWDGDITHPVTNKGPNTFGKLGETIRFYDESNVDYIDIYFDINTAISTFNSQKIDIQLFPTLSLDNQVMLIGTCQFNDTTNFVNRLRDERQFGNTSEKELSTSALQYISHAERLLHGNGVIRGFDLQDTGSTPNPNSFQLYLTGGEALVNGNFVQLNNETVIFPFIQESPNLKINWVLCVNSQGEYQPIPLLDYDPNLVTPTNPQRIFTAFNLLNGQTYNLDASTFSDIVNERKDLLPLYIVAQAVTLPSTVALVPTDVRKYSNDIDTNVALKLTSANSQGNFKNVTSIFNWLKYNNAFNGDADVKTANSVSGLVSIPMNFDYANSVTIDGKGNALLTFNNPVLMGSNVTFKNLNMVFNGGISAAVNLSNLTFENCNITITILTGSPAVDNIIFDMVNANNVTISNTTFNVIYQPLISPPPSPYTDITKYSGIFRLTNASKFMVKDSAVSATFTVNPGINIPGDIFILNNSNGVTIKDSTFSGNFNRCIGNNNSSSLKCTNLTITSSYDPFGTVGDFGYTPSNLVNSGQGYIYCTSNLLLDNVFIDNVVFNYSPLPTVTNNRFSFINFEFGARSAIFNNINITNCKFNNTQTGSTIEDVRAAISIINRVTFSALGPPNTSLQPLLINSKISGNYCNRNQSIILSSLLNTTGNNMQYPGLTTENCIIRDNICGVIGYLIASAPKVVNLVPTINASPDKSGGLLIENNVCHYIANMDSTGKYLAISKVVSGTSANQIAYPTGYVNIKGNKTNWIHIGVAFEENSSASVINNNCTAYDQSFITQFGDSGSNAYGLSAGYAIFVGSNKHVISNAQTPGEGADSSVIISGNIADTGYWFQANGVAAVYNYANGYIFSQASCIISDNILKGIGRIGTALIAVCGDNNLVTNNRVYRGPNNSLIGAYVAFLNFDTPTWAGDPAGVGAGSTGMIVENFFDKPTVDGSSTAVIGLPAIATGWRAERNKNQTVSAIIKVSSGKIGFHNGADPVLAGTNGTNIINSYVVGRNGFTFNYRDPTKDQIVTWLIPVFSVIPANCKLISASIGVQLNPGGAITSSVQNASLWFDNDILGPSALTFFNFPDTLSHTVTHNVTGYTSNQIEGTFIVFELEILDAASNNNVNATSMTVTYRW